MPTIDERGGRGSGRPKDSLMYGKRFCYLVITYRTPKEAYAKKRNLEAQGIMAIVRKWYSQHCVYRCGDLHRKRR